MLEVRKATASDVLGIRDVFMTSYGEEYPYHEFLETDTLTRMVFSENSILLVAVEAETQRVLGTASVMMNVGAFGDLTAEFGRLAVHPDARGQRAGSKLMQARLEYARHQIHVGLVENRVAHSWSQKISIKHGFVPVGFLPGKFRFIGRESVALFIRHFGEATHLRRNNPRVIPEAFPLAEFSLRNCELPCDAIVAADTVSYPHIDDFDLQEMTTDGFSSLLRIQRGRVRQREVFGPVRLHYGLFQLQARQCNYLIARRDGNITGGIGFLHDEVEKSVRIFELLAVDDQPLHFLISSLERFCREDWDVDYVEVDVNGHAPRMQQTFLECGFLPCGYLPALVFHEVERLDAVRMARVLTRQPISDPDVAESAMPLAEHVLRQFQRQAIVPEVAAAIGQVELFDGMTEEQAVTLAEICSTEDFRKGEELFQVDGQPTEMYLLLKGTVGLFTNGQTAPRAIVDRDLIGESSIVSPRPHTLSARADSDVVAAVINSDALETLMRRRRDIAVVLYRNLARCLAEKLRRSCSDGDLY